LKPGTATLPFYGIQPEVVDDAGESGAEGDERRNWWCGSRGLRCSGVVWGDPARFKQTYWSEVKGVLLHRRRLSAGQGRLFLDRGPD